MSCVLLPHSTYCIRQFLVFILFIVYRFGEIMCVRYSYVYQKYVFCFLIHECYVRSIKSYCFVCNYATVPGQLEIVIHQYNGRCVLVVYYYYFIIIINRNLNQNFLDFSMLNPLSPELNPSCYLLALLGAHHFLHVSRIRVRLLTFKLLMSYIYGAPILDVSRSNTTTQHSR